MASVPHPQGTQNTQPAGPIRHQFGLPALLPHTAHEGGACVCRIVYLVAVSPYGQCQVIAYTMGNGEPSVVVHPVDAKVLPRGTCKF